MLFIATLILFLWYLFPFNIMYMARCLTFYHYSIYWWTALNIGLHTPVCIGTNEGKCGWGGVVPSQREGLDAIYSFSWLEEEEKENHLG